MTNPWLAIPLADYEQHMALPNVGQAKLLADAFAESLQRHRPGSVAIVGCAGGNGFERLIGSGARRVVGIDVNESYVQHAEQSSCSRRCCGSFRPRRSRTAPHGAGSRSCPLESSPPRVANASSFRTWWRMVRDDSEFLKDCSCALMQWRPTPF